MASAPVPGTDAQLASYTDQDGRFACPRCGASERPKSFQCHTFRLDRATSYDLAVLVCAACSRDTVLVRRWGFQSSHAVADTGDFIEHCRMFGTDDTTTAWVRRVSAPFGRRLSTLANTDDVYLRPYRAACQTLEASPEAAAALARQCLALVLASQGYVQDCLVARIDAALKDVNPKKRLPQPARVALDALRRHDNFGLPGSSITVPADLIAIGRGEADATIDAAECLMDYYFEAPLRVEDELEALRRALAETSKG